MSKKVNKLTEPNMRLYFLLAAVFCAVTLWIEPILGLVEAGVMALTYVYFRRTAQKRREGIQRYVEDMTDDVASAGKSSMLSAPFAMMVFRPDTQEVLWSNESFLQLTDTLCLHKLFLSLEKLDLSPEIQCYLIHCGCGAFRGSNKYVGRIYIKTFKIAQHQA